MILHLRNDFFYCKGTFFYIDEMTGVDFPREEKQNSVISSFKI